MDRSKSVSRSSVNSIQMSDMTVKTIDLDSASDSREDLNAMPFLFTPRKEEIELDANLVNWVEAWYDRVMDEII